MPAVTVIAEIGVNHNGDILMAKDLIAIAASAGADIVKFQTFNADVLVTKHATKADYQKDASFPHESQREMLKKLELTHEMHLELFRCCDQNGIEFMSTGFDVNAVDYLIRLGQQRIKIPSGEITNLPYLRGIARHQRPVILSTGMSTTQEVSDAIGALTQAGQPREMMTILHCTTEYPAPIQDVNLRAMLKIGEHFRLPYGYSDHTLGIEVAIGAVAMGARIIEKHITTSRAQDGPDHKASLEPQELCAMIKAIRNVEIALGSDEKKPTEAEKKMRLVARQSIVATKQIQRGELLSPTNISTKRPGNGLSPMLWDQVIGRKAIRNFDIDECIEI